MIQRLWLFLICLPSLAASAQPWLDHEGARTRLIEGPQQDGVIYLGWEVQLEDGWKTYWRSPGEAGLPPRLSLDGSENVADAQLRFPIPRRFDFFGIESIGYEKQLVLPLAVTLNDAAQSAHIVANMSFMVCSDICIPHEGRYELTLQPASTAAPDDALRIQAALDQVPNPSGVGPLSIGDVVVRGPAGRQRLSISVTADTGLSDPVLFVESTEDLGLGAPVFALLGDGTSGRFTVSSDGGPDGVDLAGKDLTFTLYDPAIGAVERQVRLK